MNKLNPLVSIITGYYNREHLVDESLQSLIDQTYSNIEIIIFDDCSTDNTYKKLCRFKIDKRVISFLNIVFCNNAMKKKK